MFLRPAAEEKGPVIALRSTLGQRQLRIATTKSLPIQANSPSTCIKIVSAVGEEGYPPCHYPLPARIFNAQARPKGSIPMRDCSCLASGLYSSPSVAEQSVEASGGYSYFRRVGPGASPERVVAAPSHKKTPTGGSDRRPDLRPVPRLSGGVSLNLHLFFGPRVVLRNPFKFKPLRKS